MAQEASACPLPATEPIHILAGETDARRRNSKMRRGIAVVALLVIPAN